jgi:hypothetical protein
MYYDERASHLIPAESYLASQAGAINNLTTRFCEKELGTVFKVRCYKRQNERNVS